MTSPGPCLGKGWLVSSITSMSPVLENVMALMVAGNWDIVEQLETVVRGALWFIFVSGNLNVG